MKLVGYMFLDAHGNKIADITIQEYDQLMDRHKKMCLGIMKKQPIQSQESREETDAVNSIHFGRQLLKYATPAFDKDGMLCWSYENNLYNTDELYEIFKKTSEL